MGYLANFIVYLFAMTGLIGLSVFVFKITNGKNVLKKGTDKLKVLESMSLGARKSLYIIEAEGEKFLIAGDAERTSLISKLESFKQPHNSIEVRKSKSYSDENSLGITGIKKTPYDSVMKNLAEKIRN